MPVASPVAAVRIDAPAPSSADLFGAVACKLWFPPDWQVAMPIFPDVRLLCREGLPRHGIPTFGRVFDTCVENNHHLPKGIPGRK